VKKVLAFMLVMFSVSAFAQQQCVCTAGCKIASDPFPLTGPQPSTCNVYKAGTVIASGSAVLANTIPTSNGTVCVPASTTYNAGPAGSLACLVPIPAQPTGNVTLTMTGVNSQGESAQSASFSFQSVSSLAPPSPTGLRVSP
jgi:hypothetical protein